MVSTYTYGLLRHGETEWNRQKRVQGHGDSPLTEQGRTTLTNWADFLAGGGWTHILCSDLGRVQESVAIINRVLQLPVTIDKRLREQNWGDWEEMKVDDVRRDFAALLAVEETKGWDFRPPNGESRREVLQRALAALADSRTLPSSGKMLVVCHLGLIKCLIYHTGGCSFLPNDNIILKKGSLHHLLFADGSYRIARLNISPGEIPQ